MTSTRLEATQRVMAAKLSRLIHKIAIELHLTPKSKGPLGIYSRRREDNIKIVK
jgi:hypothetical protein